MPWSEWQSRLHGKEHTGLNGRESGSPSISLTQAAERLLVAMNRLPWMNENIFHGSYPSLRGWGLGGGAQAPSQAHTSLDSLAAFGVHESTRLRDFPAGSFLRTAILAVSRQLLDRPQAWEVDGLGIHIL